MKKDGLISKKTYSKISEKLMLLRLELKINNRSHSSYFKDNNIQTINDIIIKWDDLRDFWRKQIGNIKFVEYLNEKEVRYLQNKERGIYIDYLTCKGIEHIGLDILYGLLENLEADANRRYKITNTIFSKFEKLQGKQVNCTKKIVAKLIAKKY
ncbi:hypothetical protein [Flavobacterium sp.]|uniref:hypothetical protein n=1 Tax=Flavobacterium sp. TaxID=239 RepID=UPI0039E46162